MDKMLTTLLNSLTESLFVYHFTVYFGPAPNLDQNQAGEDVEHVVVAAVMTLLVSDKENNCS